MPDRPVLTAALTVVALAIAAAIVVESGILYTVDDPEIDGYERTTLTTYDDNGSRLATVEVRIADTRDKRYLGLSDTEQLPSGEGMLFVHERESRHAYVMRRMSFDLDIVFVGANETVTTIHHAPAPDGEYEKRYRGTGRWVLEVPRGWTNRTGLDAGDRVAVPPAGHDVGG